MELTRWTVRVVACTVCVSSLMITATLLFLNWQEEEFVMSALRAAARSEWPSGALLVLDNDHAFATIVVLLNVAVGWTDCRGRSAISTLAWCGAIIGITATWVALMCLVILYCHCSSLA